MRIAVGKKPQVAIKIYLPIDTAKNYPNVAQEEKDPNSQLNYVKKLIEMRKAHPALGTQGEWTLISDVNQAYPMVYLRSTEKERILVVLNPSGKEVECTFPSFGIKKPVQIWGDSKKCSYKSGKENDKIKVKAISFVMYQL